MLEIDKNLYNEIYKEKLENEQIILEFYQNFDNYTFEEKFAATEIITNLNIINEEYEKYITIYNNTILEDEQSQEYVTIYGDTFQKIAAKKTGNYNNWKAIMEFNGITDPIIESGTIIQIPENLE
jgi:hypothetical protein